MTRRSPPGPKAVRRLIPPSAWSGRFGEAGLTLLEVLVSTLLIALTIGGIAPLFGLGQPVWEEADRRLDMLGNARLALDKLVREMRVAQSFSVISSTSLNFSVFYSEENVASNPGSIYPAWWNSAWPARKAITVSAGNVAVPTGYSVSLAFDHAGLVNAGKSLASGNDVRVLYWNGTNWVELDRVLDSASSWNTASTRIWFKTQAAIGANGSDAGYYLYYGNSSAGAPPANASNVFLLFDDFEASSVGSVPSGWSVFNGTWSVQADPTDTSKKVLRAESSNVYIYRTNPLGAFDTELQVRVRITGGGIDTAPAHRYSTTLDGTGQPPSYRAPRYSTSPSYIWKRPGNCGLASASFAQPADVWYVRRIRATDSGSSVILDARSVDEANPGTFVQLNATDTGGSGASGCGYAALTGNQRIGLYALNASASAFAYFDNVRVRLYVSPEPTTALGRVVTVEYQLNGATNELEYRVVPDAFSRLAGPFRSMTVECFDAAGASVSCSAPGSVRSVQVQLTAMDPTGQVADLAVTSRAYRRVP